MVNTSTSRTPPSPRGGCRPGQATVTFSNLPQLTLKNGRNNVVKNAPVSARGCLPRGPEPRQRVVYAAVVVAPIKQKIPRVGRQSVVVELEAAAGSQQHDLSCFQRESVTCHSHAHELGELGRLSSAQLMPSSQQEAHGHWLGRPAGLESQKVKCRSRYELLSAAAAALLMSLIPLLMRLCRSRGLHTPVSADKSSIEKRSFEGICRMVAPWGMSRVVAMRRALPAGFTISFTASLEDKSWPSWSTISARVRRAKIPALRRA